MLIKLSSGAQVGLDALKKKITVGSEVFRYVFTEAYDKGDVIEIDDDLVTVDFTDTIRSFDSGLFTLVFGNGHDEHWAVFDEGTIREDYRGRQLPPQKFQSLDSLLDFENWMV